MEQRGLVSAGASGIGRVIVRAFAADGAQVFVCDIDGDTLRFSTAAPIRSAGNDMMSDLEWKRAGKK